MSKAMVINFLVDFPRMRTGGDKNYIEEKIFKVFILLVSIRLKTEKKRIFQANNERSQGTFFDCFFFDFLV